MSNRHVYDPTSRPVGSYDQTLIPTKIVHRSGYVSINRLGVPLLPDDDKLTVAWLAERLERMTADDYPVNRTFFDGNHWQDATQWSGPMPNPAERDAQLALAAIERGFVSRNCIREVVTRQANSVLSREPSWYLTNNAPRGSNEPLSSAEEELRKVGEGILTGWWDRVNASDIMLHAVQNALLGKRSALRLYVPPGLLDPNGRVPVPPGDLEAATNFIELDAPEPTEAGVIVDRASRTKYGAYIFTDDEGVQSNTGEIVFTSIPVSSTEPPTTTIRLVGDEESADGVASTDGTTLLTDLNVREVTLQIGGRLTIFELELDQLATEQVRQQQRAINKALTMGDHNVEVAGFVERTIFNGQMPGHYESDPDRPGRKRFVRDNYVTGGGAINFVNGIPVYDEQGTLKGVADPSMHVRQPALPDAFERTERWFYAALLDECHQAHYLLAGSEYVSGESRIQSRAEYVEALRKVKKVVDAAGRWLLETVLSLASWFAAEPLRFEPMRISFSARIVPGPATAEGVQSAIDLRNAGGLSREGMMERTDIEDIDAEVRRIENEEAQGVTIPGPQVPAALMQGMIPPKPKPGQSNGRQQPPAVQNDQVP